MIAEKFEQCQIFWYFDENLWNLLLFHLPKFEMTQEGKFDFSFVQRAENFFTLVNKTTTLTPLWAFLLLSESKSCLRVRNTKENKVNLWNASRLVVSFSLVKVFFTKKQSFKFLECLNCWKVTNLTLELCFNNANRTETHDEN